MHAVIVYVHSCQMLLTLGKYLSLRFWNLGGRMQNNINGSAVFNISMRVQCFAALFTSLSPRGSLDLKISIQFILKERTLYLFANLRLHKFLCLSCMIMSNPSAFAVGLNLMLWWCYPKYISGSCRNAFNKKLFVDVYENQMRGIYITFENFNSSQFFYSFKEILRYLGE